MANAAVLHLPAYLLTEPDILLLDEPTNHLDAESVAWLERHLQQYRGTVIAVTHDRYFLDNVAGSILELDRGYGIPWTRKLLVLVGIKNNNVWQWKKRANRKRQRTLQRELELSRMSPKGASIQRQSPCIQPLKNSQPGSGTIRGKQEIYIPARTPVG